MTLKKLYSDLSKIIDNFLQKRGYDALYTLRRRLS